MFYIAVDRVQVPRKAICASLFLLVLLSLLIIPAAEGLPVTGCTVINSPGSYLLQNDILDSSATFCIHVQSSDVIFDGNGFAIDGINATSTWGIYINDPLGGNLTNVTVRNTVMSDWGPFDAAIRGWHAENCSIINNSISHTGTAIDLGYASNSIIHANNASGNSGDGIVVTYSDAVRITNNTASNNDVIGFYFQNVNASILRNNTARYDSQEGIGYYMVRDCNLSENVVEFNGIGMWVDNTPSFTSMNNTYFAKTISSNKNQGIYR
ncbi:MAG: NosD domain-containing protein, partial [Methanoregula sp.]|nr:NosD domain-containing protein [Methanoregula sp.]